ncbi:MAG: cohesin domain-containing protein, partial [Coriobacteriia bacterium]|nr:cohesin domain-containing protein [Coriobacteriia bacterium]
MDISSRGATTASTTSGLSHKLLSILLTLALVIGFVPLSSNTALAAGENFGLTYGDPTNLVVKAGDTVQVPVNMIAYDSAKALNAAQIDFNYDNTALSVESVTFGSAFANASTDWNTPSAGNLRLSFYNFTGDATAGVSVATITLKAAADTTFTDTTFAAPVAVAKASDSTDDQPVAVQGLIGISSGRVDIPDQGAQFYTGSAITPYSGSINKVKVDGTSTRIYEGTDYTVTYTNNVELGKATATLTGIGKYIGTK